MKKFSSIIIGIVFFCVSIINIDVCYARSTKPNISARSAILYDVVEGKIVYSKNIYTKRPPASLTKIMTAIVVLDRLKLNRKVRVSRKASLSQPSKVYLRQGEYYSVKDLLYAMLLNSGNDAAVCLSEAVAGSEWKFVQLMNKRARSLGARKTHFINASGLPGKGQYSTAYDLAKIMKEAARYPFIRKAMGSKVHTIRRPNGKRIRLRNHNKLLWRYSKKVIGKTGYTCAAGRCYIGYATYGSRKMVVCVLNSRRMWADTRSLLDYVFGRDNSQIVFINKKLHGKTATKQIQRALHRAGCNPGKIDGKFGIKTLQAVFNFQRLCGLKVDGIVGTKTMSKLRKFM